MKSRRKVELVIKDLKRFALDPNREANGLPGYQIIFDLMRFWEELSGDPANMRELLRTARLLSSARGPGQSRTEEDLLKILLSIADHCRDQLQAHQVSLSSSAAVPAKARPYCEVLHELAQYAVWCLGFRKNRDAFGGRRRVAAFEILSIAGQFMELPEAVRCAKELEKSDRDDGAAATHFLMDYHEARGLASPMEAQIFQLKIVLLGISPPIWRRVLVSSDYLLGDLPYVINTAMGWSGWHCHAFRCGKISYSGSDIIAEWGSSARDEDSVTLANLLKRKGQTLLYKYDFGDGWEHAIKLEEILPPDANLLLPICLAGERASPPEDCGGVHGYARVIEALRHPDDPKFEEFREWIGPYDPEKFDLDQVNSKLKPDTCSPSEH